MLKLPLLFFFEHQRQSRSPFLFLFLLRTPKAKSRRPFWWGPHLKDEPLVGLWLFPHLPPHPPDPSQPRCALRASPPSRTLRGSEDVTWRKLRRTDTRRCPTWSDPGDPRKKPGCFALHCEQMCKTWPVPAGFEKFPMESQNPSRLFGAPSPKM